MKLPTNSKDKLKWFGLITGASVIVLYGTFMGLIRPMRHRTREGSEQLVKLERQIRTARRQVQTVLNERESNLQVLADILELTGASGYVLRARLGNYLLSSTEAVERCARNVGVEVDSIREVAISALPKSRNDGENFFNAYTVRIGLECGLHDLIRFLNELENSNPFLCVSTVTIVGQAPSPARHDISMEVQWPIWVDEEVPGRLREQLQEAEGLEGLPEADKDPEPSG